MSIFRKEKDKTKQLGNLSPEAEELPAQEAEPSEELTDISETGYDSSPTAPDNKMEEIYSTKDKQVKFRRREPLAEEAAAKRKEAAKEELMRGKMEFSATEDDTPEVKLEAELDPNAIVAEEIFEDVVDVKKLRNIYVQDIDDIDVSLDPAEAVREYERRANDTERRDKRQKPEEEYVPSGEIIVAKVPVYQHESKFDYIFLKAGRFTDVVEDEYDEYLKSTDPTISGNYHSMRPQVKPHQSLLYTLSQAAAKRKQEAEERHKNKEAAEEQKIREAEEQKVSESDEDIPVEEEIKPQEKKKKRSGIGKFFRVLGAVISSGFTSPSQAEQERSLDYNGREDEQYIAERIHKNYRRLAGSLILISGLMIVMIALAVWERTGGAEAVAANGPAVALVYCAIQLVLVLGLGFAARHTLIDGLKPLRRFKGNCMTVASLAYAGCVIQGIVSLFTSGSFVGGDHHLYGFAVAIALTLNVGGRLMMVMRVKSNFEFISSRSPAYAAKIYDDEETARRMAGGTTASKGVAAYQHMTSFLSDFLKISYAPDPSEEISGRFMPVAVISAIFVTVLYAILFHSVQGAVSALTVMLCIGIPFTSMVAGNLPMLLFSRRMQDEDAMVAGYPSVRQFCEADSLLMRAADIFPYGCVEIRDILPLQEFRVEDGLMMAAAVLREANSPIAQIFDDPETQSRLRLPMVESVMYEDKSGLVGWIGGERVLIGNMTLMERYHISVPESPKARRIINGGGQITYIAVSGYAVALLSLEYIASPIAQEQLQKAERSGLALIVSTTDANVTAELISELYGLFFRSVKVTPPGYSNTIDEAVERVEETSRAFLATRGHIGSLARAVAGCIGIRANIRLGIALEIFGMLLGILLSATLALYASVARLSAVELLFYIGFWIVATLVAEVIKRP